MDRGQRVGERNGVTCLVIFTSGFVVIKMLKMVFSADCSKMSVIVWAKYVSASKRSYLALSENAMDHWILSYH